MEPSMPSTQITAKKTSARVLEKRALLSTELSVEQQRTTASASEGTLAMLSKDPSMLFAIYAFAGGLVIALIFLLCYMIYARRRRRQRRKMYDELYETMVSARESGDRRAARRKIRRSHRSKQKQKSRESEEARVKKVSASKESRSKEKTPSKESMNALKEKPLKGSSEGSKEMIKASGEQAVQTVDKTALEKLSDDKAKESEQAIENVDELIKAIKENKVALATAETGKMERSN